MLIDTHCHLTDERFTDVGDVLKKAFEAGVEKVIMPSTSVEDAKKVVQIAERYEQYCLVGIHPEEVEEMFGGDPDGFRVKPGMTNGFSGLAESGRTRGSAPTGTTGDQQGVSSQEYPDGFPIRSGMTSVLTESVMEELQKIIKGSKRVMGVGEIGLDFHYDVERKTEMKQRELFRAQMELALENNLPVAIHMREAEEEMREELETFIEKNKRWDGFRVKPGMTGGDSGLPGYRATARVAPTSNDGGDGFRVGARNDGNEDGKARLLGQFHCFAGSEGFLKKILDWGFYVSFGGNITYKSAGNLRELLKKVPLDRLLLETDSPYLPPEPLRGTVNTPGNVKITAEFVAQELKMSFLELAQTTTQNAKCLYSLDI